MTILSRIGSNRLQLNDFWNPHPNGDRAIVRLIMNPIITMGSDYMVVIISLDQPTTNIIQIDREEVSRETPKEEIITSFDGSRTITGSGHRMYDL